MKNKLITMLCISVASLALGIAGFYLLSGNQPEVIKSSSTLLYKSKADLMTDSDIIISGKVSSSRPGKWSNPGLVKGKRNIIQTDYIIDINKIYKGIPYDDKKIAVRIDKGKAGDIEIISDSYPDFNIGEEVLLFLSKDDSDIANPDENYYVLTGALQGKFSVKETKETGKVFANDKDTIVLSRLEDEIKQNIDRAIANPKPTRDAELVKAQNEKILGKE